MKDHFFCVFFYEEHPPIIIFILLSYFKMKEKQYIVNILEIIDRTHDVRTFKVEKPDGYQYIEWQATEVSIHMTGFEEKKRPFTFTGLHTDDYLEFTIKMYDDHQEGMTKHLRQLRVGDSFILGDSWGAIHYQGNGVFIAGGAGVTPFIAILRMLQQKKALTGNTLLFSNKTIDDVLMEKEWKQMKNEGLNLVLNLTRENSEKAKSAGYLTGRIDASFLHDKITDWKQHFYLCWPLPMVKDLHKTLIDLGADITTLVIEN